jgi:glycolate oxidase iron-sulfur subunit
MGENAFASGRWRRLARGIVHKVSDTGRAKRLRARQVGNIEKLEPHVIAAGNVGCLAVATGTAIPVVHTIELIDWATGGRVPPALQETLTPVSA